MQSGERAAVRFRTPENREIVFTDLVRGDIRFHTDVIGDQVLLRSDGHPAYNFAVVVDDGLMGVTHVVRGEDHISNTPRQILIYEALGFTAPAFGHVAMVLGPDHTKLSKRHGAVSVDEFREKGYLPEALLNYLALLSWSPGENQELVPIAEMAKRFSLSDVGHSASVFDEEKLAWVNRHYLKDADHERLARLSMPYLERAGYLTGRLKPKGLRISRALCPCSTRRSIGSIRCRCVCASCSSFLRPRRSTTRRFAAKRAKAPARQVIDALADELRAAPRLLDKQAFRGVADRVKQKTGQKGRALFHPIRIALTGAGDGPELDLLVPAMERGAALDSSTGIVRITGARERAQQFASALDQ